MLTVEQAAKLLSIAEKTVYEYCTNFFAYGEYGPMSQPLEGEEEALETIKKRKTVRKLFHYRRSQGDIRVPRWAVELFQMQYAKKKVHPLTTTRGDMHLLFGDEEPYRQWQGRGGEQRIT